MTVEAQPRIEHLLRELAPQALAAIVRRYRDFAASEDAVQEALLSAATKWPQEGLPESPRAWLIHVAARRIVDHVRAEAARRHREELVVSLVPVDEQIALGADDPSRPPARDDTLELFFMCCHPALTQSSALALTLRAVGGLSTAEIAKAFLVPEATMAQRIGRAKQSIKDAGTVLSRPTGREFAARLQAVMHALYLIFSEGYVVSGGPALTRTDLSSEALRLTRVLHSLVPDEPEVSGLLALMLLTDARSAARTGPSGELIPLDQQDRARWDRAAIAEGTALIQATLPRAAVGPYQVQAAIAALHDEAASTDATDWPQVLALYGLLEQMSDNPMVSLNLAIATAMVHGPAAGLLRLDALEADPRLSGHHRFDAVRAHLLERAGESEQARVYFRRAAEHTASTAERNYLLLRASRDSEP